MRRIITTGALVGVLALTACTPEPESGTVTEKEYDPEDWVTSQRCTSNYDAKGKYKGQTCYPVTTYYPECWEVDYEDTEGAEGEDCVSEDLYNALDIGDEYHKGMAVPDVR